MVMTNLDSEVKELSTSTVDTMKQCMAKVSTLENKNSFVIFTRVGLCLCIYIDCTRLSYGTSQ